MRRNKHEGTNENDQYAIQRKVLIEKANNEDWLFETKRSQNNMLDKIKNIHYITDTTTWGPLILRRRAKLKYKSRIKNTIIFDVAGKIIVLTYNQIYQK